ncbi:hypothetical protein CLIM01_04681 [Colletotrichum limetticola]|uniref:Transmembrane protein n=1 Tax=Colletotrichum limetticola TaxID=1209924 RepID=A0ABQ9Q2B1_9PEZI|nr:hypothetical protein CLIM01_04681 [Colletotrichum limetticola]
MTEAPENLSASLLGNRSSSRSVPTASNRRQSVDSLVSSLDELSHHSQDLADAVPNNLGDTGSGAPPTTRETFAQSQTVATDERPVSQIKCPKRKFEFFVFLTDCAALLSTLGLLIFGLIVWRSDGTQITEENRGTRGNTINVLATVFPILFASVVGRLVSEAARWKLENGATVRSLELLLGSRTVGATALTLVQFRSFNILSIFLVFLWTFSPLGTQSLLRMNTSRLEPNMKSTGLIYFDSGARSQLADWGNSEVSGSSVVYTYSKFRSLATLYTSLVAAPQQIKNDNMDIWGNVKIPFFNGVDENWKNITDNATFSLESDYIHLECKNLTKIVRSVTSEDIREDLISDEGLKDFGTTYRAATNRSRLLNGTWHGYSSTRSGSTATTWSLSLDRFVDPVWFAIKNYPVIQPDKAMRPILFQGESGIEVGKPTLLFQAASASSMHSPEGFIRTYCGVRQRYVESKVNCWRLSSDSRHNCSVAAMRPSQRQHAPEAVSQLSFPPNFNYLSREMPLTVGGIVSYQSDVSLYYIQDPTLRGMSSTERSFLENITEADVSVRLSQLINTYMLLSQLSFQITGSDAEASLETNQTVVAQSSELVLRYSISKSWAAAFLFSSSLLFLSAVVGVIFKHWARGPEVLGYVSTVIRDSKYISLASPSGWKDGVDLSTEIASQRIRFGVVMTASEEKLAVGVGKQEDTRHVKELDTSDGSA